MVNLDQNNSMPELNPQIADRVRVFVYGTLKPGEINYQRFCTGKVIDAQKATTLGQLFALPMGYPAMTNGTEVIHGYLLTFGDSQILNVLDELEDYQRAREISINLYNRESAEVYDLKGWSLGRAWIYVMNPERVIKLGGIHLVDGCWNPA